MALLLLNVTEHIFQWRHVKSHERVVSELSLKDRNPIREFWVYHYIGLLGFRQKGSRRRKVGNCDAYYYYDFLQMNFESEFTSVVNLGNTVSFLIKKKIFINNRQNLATRLFGVGVVSVCWNRKVKRPTFLWELIVLFLEENLFILKAASNGKL